QPADGRLPGRSAGGQGAFRDIILGRLVVITDTLLNGVEVEALTAGQADGDAYQGADAIGRQRRQQHRVLAQLARADPAYYRCSDEEGEHTQALAEEPEGHEPGHYTGADGRQQLDRKSTR